MHLFGLDHRQLSYLLNGREQQITAGREARLVSEIVKEFAPGGLRSGVGWVADRALSGDRVDFLAPFELRALAARAWPGLAAFWTPLFELDPPNYCFVFQQLRIA
jgi:hypothetical protein